MLLLPVDEDNIAVIKWIGWSLSARLFYDYCIMNSCLADGFWEVEGFVGMERVSISHNYLPLSLLGI